MRLKALREQLGFSAHEVAFQLGISRSAYEGLDPDLDAVSMASEQVGALVLSNSKGRRMETATQRRVSWTHELCHLLYDRPKMLEIKRFCSISRPPRRGGQPLWRQLEQRARAFAVYFIAPREGVLECWSGGPKELRVRAVMERFGLGYEATRSHLDNLKLLSLRDPLPRVPDALPSWEDREPDTNIQRDLLALGVPTLRAGMFGEAAIDLWRSHLEVTSGQIADLLHIHPFRLQEFLGDHRR